MGASAQVSVIVHRVCARVRVCEWVLFLLWSSVEKLKSVQRGSEDHSRLGSAGSGSQTASCLRFVAVSRILLCDSQLKTTPLWLTEKGSLLLKSTSWTLQLVEFSWHSQIENTTSLKVCVGCVLLWFVCLFGFFAFYETVVQATSPSLLSTSFFIWPVFFFVSDKRCDALPANITVEAVMRFWVTLIKLCLSLLRFVIQSF